MVTIPTPPIWTQNRKYSARLDRNFADILFGEGVLDPGGGDFAIAETSPLSNSVVVDPGRAIIQGDDELNQGKYVVRLESLVNVLLQPAPTSDARIDLIVLQVNDSVAGSVRTPADVAQIDVIEGAVSAVPVMPAVPDTAIPLASVLRTTGDTFIDNSMITDERTAGSQQSYSINSRFEQLTTTERNALTPFTGQTIFNTTTNQIEYYDGANWVGPTALSGLSDVSIPSPNDRDVLVYNSSSGDWEADPLDTQAINAQTGTTYTLALTDANKLVTLSNIASITLTVPTNASVAFSVGHRIDILQGNTGDVTVSPAGGVTIDSKSGFTKLSAQYAAATLFYRGSDNWFLIGDIAA
jgi:hypothetical protein